MKKITKHTTKQYTSFAELRKIIKRLKWLGYEREGMTTYSFRTTNSAYYIHLVKIT